MSNDKTTLADVQPGGRVRLGDQAERARFEAWHREKLKTSWQTGAPTRDMHNGVYADNYGPAEEQVRWEAWQAALSAQPSPGGQEDALQLANDWRHVFNGDGHDMAGANKNTIRRFIEAIEALAARQPVGEPVARLIEAIEGECSGLAINNEMAAAILAHVFPLGHAPDAYMVGGRLEQGLFFDKAAAENMAAMNAGDVVPLFRPTAQAVTERQPVGEPEAYRNGDEFVCAAEYATMRSLGHDGSGWRPLYDAPPAQAVDLGDFKALYRAYVRLLESGRDRIRDLGGTCDPVDVMEANDIDLQAARRVLDSQAVGK